MSIQFSGVGSGLPVDDWINAIIQAESARLGNLQKQKSGLQTSRTALNTVESKFSSFRSSIEDLTDANLSSAFDLFKRKKITGSDSDIASATVSSNAAIQKIELEVSSLATATTAKSSSTIGQTIDGTESFLDLSNGDAEEGSFSIYTDGVKNEFTIEKGDTVQDIVDDINNSGIVGLSAQVNSGKFEITYDTNNISDVKLGSSADTSNFLNVMNLSTADAAAGAGTDMTFSSTDAVSKVDTNGKIVGNTANLSGSFTESSYTFKIGNAEFDIGSGTTFQDLINNINSDDDAGVIARYDYKENKLMLTAREAGETAISLEDTSGDFLEQMGLITAGGDSLSSQTLGDNAVVYVNGSTTALEANSNTLTSDITGLSGITINLKDVTEAGETITFNVEQDTEQLTNAVSDFISKFNTVINEIDSKTKYGKDLSGEYSLVSLRNSLRMTATGSVDGLSNYDSFGMIGISTGDIGKGTDETTNTLKLDKDKFLEALQERPDEVKALLIGDSETGTTGVLQKLESKVESALDPVNGYFAAREGSMDSQISDIDKSIIRETERLDTREEYLVRQFNQMDQYISQMQQQSQALAMLGI